MNRHEIDVIESSVTIPDVLELHSVKRYGKRCCCPIHHGKRQNFSFTDKLFHCFTCGESGGVIQLEAKLDGISDDEACKTLAKQFGLDISVQPFTRRDRQEWREQKKLEADYDDYQNKLKQYYNRLSVLFRNIKDVPELQNLSASLEKWLDENIDGVVQEWEYLNLQQTTI